MPSALGQIGGPPPAPNPTPQDNSSSALSAPFNAPAPGGAPPSMGGQPVPGMPPQGPQPPSVSHAQAVAGVKHFMMVEQELTKLLDLPECGKSDIKSQIIDSATDAVSKGLSTASDAVSQLGTVPEKPYDQRAWLMQHLQAAMKASDAIVNLHRVSNPPGAQVNPANHYKADDHMTHVNGLLSQFKGA